MAAAAKAASTNGWVLSDSSWPGYTELPHRLMEGYLVMAAKHKKTDEISPNTYFSAGRCWGPSSCLCGLFQISLG